MVQNVTNVSNVIFTCPLANRTGWSHQIYQRTKNAREYNLPKKEMTFTNKIKAYFVLDVFVKNDYFIWRIGRNQRLFFPSKKVITPLQSDENHSLDNHGSFWRSLLSLLIISQITFWLRSRQKFLFLICIPLLQDLQMKKQTIIRC